MHFYPETNKKLASTTLLAVPQRKTFHNHQRAQLLEATEVEGVEEDVSDKNPNDG